jgi:hypothetical protein
MTPAENTTYSLLLLFALMFLLHFNGRRQRRLAAVSR